MEPTEREVSGSGASPPRRGAFRHRNYRLFFFGQLISLIGTWMQSVAQSWLVYRLTGSEAMLGAIAFAGQIPVLLFAIPGGVVADRVPRRRILLVTQTAAMLLALALAALTFSERVEVWHVVTLAATLGIANAFDMPARQAFVLDMVAREDLSNAIALNSTMVNGARIVGPALAGLLVAAVGEAWCFAANGSSYVAVIAGLLAMHGLPALRERVRTSAVEEIREGLRFAAGEPPVRALLLVIALTSVMGSSFSVLMPIFADRILRHGASGMGVLTACSGVGALAAGVTLARRASLRGLGRTIAIAGVVFGGALVVFALSRTFWVSAVALVPAGFAMMMQTAGTNTLIQSMTPDALRGRVMALYSMMFLGMLPIGALVSGSLAAWLGAPVAVAIGGSAVAIGGMIFGWRLPTLRDHARTLVQTARDSV